MDEEKEDYRRKLASAEQDKVKLERDAKKLKAEHKEKNSWLSGEAQVSGGREPDNNS